MQRPGSGSSSPPSGGSDDAVMPTRRLQLDTRGVAGSDSSSLSDTDSCAAGSGGASPGTGASADRRLTIAVVVSRARLGGHGKGRRLKPGGGWPTKSDTRSQIGGTRGDVQPALALSIQLASLGHRVRLAADARFAPLALDARRRAGLGGPPPERAAGGADEACGCGRRPGSACGFVAAADADAEQAAGSLEFFALAGDAGGMMRQTVQWGGMLPTSLRGMAWLRGQIRELAGSVWDAVSAQGPPTPDGSAPAALDAVASGGGGGVASPAAGFRPDLIIANQLAYGQASAPSIARRGALPPLACPCAPQSFLLAVPDRFAHPAVRLCPTSPMRRRRRRSTAPRRWASPCTCCTRYGPQPCQRARGRARSVARGL
jgi:hypothetical protein